MGTAIETSIYRERVLDTRVEASAVLPGQPRKTNAQLNLKPKDRSRKTRGPLSGVSSSRRAPPGGSCSRAVERLRATAVVGAPLESLREQWSTHAPDTPC